MEECLYPRETHRDARLCLAFIHPLDACSENFRHISGKVHPKGDHRNQHRIDVDGGKHHVEDQHQDNQHWRAPQKTNVDPGRSAQQARSRHPHETDDGAQQRAEYGRQDRENNRGLQTIPDEQITILVEQIASNTLGDGCEKRAGSTPGGRFGVVGGNIALEGNHPVTHFVVWVREVDLPLSFLSNVDGGRDHVDLV